MSNDRHYRPAFATTLDTPRTYLEPVMTTLTVTQHSKKVTVGGGRDEQAAEIAHLQMLQAESIAAFKKLFPNGAVIDSGSEFLE